MAPVKVFGPARSTNVARVLVCLEEVGAEYEVVNIDFRAKEHKSPEHLARNVSSCHFTASLSLGRLRLHEW
jgi:glutathione S-transferase